MHAGVEKCRRNVLEKQAILSGVTYQRGSNTVETNFLNSEVRRLLYMATNNTKTTTFSVRKYIYD